jgi:lia operon protein LiaG
MIRKSLIGLICIFAAGVQLRATQDFERSYDLIPGRHITIDNKMGDIKVTGYDGEDVKVVARKEGPDQDEIEIVDRNFGPRVLLFPKFDKFKSTETKVNFEVKVPNDKAPLFMELKSGSGKIDVRDFNGWLIADSSRGEAKFVNVKGSLYARSISGSIDAEIDQSKERTQMRFDSMSGDIRITAPPDLDALIAMRSMSGDLETNFPLNIKKRRYGERTANGKLGKGMEMIWISSVSGSVSLMKK